MRFFFCFVVFTPLFNRLSLKVQCINVYNAKKLL